MSAKRRVKGWWVICLMAGLGAQPLCAAESGAISRAVEVAPPAGWTPDTPLFHDEASAPGREAAQAPNPIRAERRPDAASRAVAGNGTSLKEARVAKAKRGTRAVAQAARSAKAGKSAVSPRTISAKRGTERGAERRGDRVSGRAASARRHASAVQTAAAPVARPAKAKRSGAAALAPRQSVAVRQKATRAGTRPGHAAKGPAKARPAAGSPGVKKG